MGRTRILTRLAGGTLVVAVAAGGGLLLGGVADAAPLAASSSVSAALAATGTTTTLIVAPSSFPEGLPVSLVAIVTPRGAAGAVQFKDGDTTIGDPVTVQSGTGTIVTNGQRIDTNSSAAVLITSGLAVGAHSLTAEFTPTDSEAYAPSVSPSETLTITPPIFVGFPLDVHSLLQSVLGGVPGGVPGGGLPGLPGGLPGGFPFGGLPGVDGNQGPFKVDLSPIFGGLPGHTPTVDPGQIIQSVLGGLHF
ncbi:MAG: Ig-like domain-containing protein [Pseudonocardiaceae bacterium]